MLKIELNMKLILLINLFVELIKTVQSYCKKEHAEQF